jgi:hypothetical protein
MQKQIATHCFACKTGVELYSLTKLLLMRIKWFSLIRRIHAQQNLMVLGAE